MQSTIPQRPSQRQMQRQPTDPGQQQLQPRNVSGTSRGHGSKSSNPDKQISQIEKSVTHLLVATKQLLETLTQWSRGTAQEEEVSDVYVRLGYEFNLACRAFNSIGVDTSDLGPVPDLLRTILEDTLSQPASPQALDNYLPRIRDIIINLLQGLKRKQSKLRTKSTKDAGSTNSRAGTPARQGSVASIGSNEISSMVDTAPLPGQSSSIRDELNRDSPSNAMMDSQKDWTPANSSVGTLERSAANRRSIRKDGPMLSSADSSSTISSTTAQHLPVVSPISESITLAPTSNFLHGPPPPPKQDALTALQRGGDLERRASRRFSAYQISKHLGASPNGVPVIPAAQNSPIPNRGREVRESMRAVTSRTSNQQPRQKSNGSKLNEGSPSRSGTFRAPQRISEEREELPSLSTDIPKIPEPDGSENVDSPIVKTPEEFHRGKMETVESPGPKMTATLNGPLTPDEPFLPSTEVLLKDAEPMKAELPAPKELEETSRPSITPEPSTAVEVGSSPPQTKELTLFLQYKSRIKKYVLTGGYEEVTLARLQLAFIEKFAWNTHNNGVDLPEIYLQDPVSGVRHELEDLSDVKDRSVLVLNVEVLDEVKKHFDDGIGGIRTTLESVKSLLSGQENLMQRFSDRQLEASKEMARLSAVPPPRTTRFPTVAGQTITSSVTPSESSIQEVQNLRRDLAVLRQSYATMASDFSATIDNIKLKAANVKDAATNLATPTYEGNAGRAHVNDGKKVLQTDSESLVNRVDDLSDIVEDLRKDVVTRGVRPRPKQLEDISKEISLTAKALLKMKEFMKREKPIWTKIWEQELNLVCTERDDLTQQEDLMADLDGDLEDVQNVFNLVEEATKQQNLQSTTGVKSGLRTVEIDPTVDPNAAKEGVLGEVRALRPNHEDRLEAIERAEKARRRDLETRNVNVFHKEIETFVEESKLKKVGGMDEVERLRKLKDERARKENWETAQAHKLEMEKKRAERAAAKAAAATAAVSAPAPETTNEESAMEVQPEPKNDIIDSALPTSSTNEHEAENSQDSEGTFLDAPTGITPQPTPSITATERIEDNEESAPLPPAKDDVEEHIDSEPKLSHFSITSTDVDIDELEVEDHSHDANSTSYHNEITTYTADVTESSSNELTNTSHDEEVKEMDKETEPDQQKQNRGSWWKPAVF